MDALTVAIAAAREAGALICRQFHQPNKVALKGPSDIVTQVDRDAENLIVARIRSAFPDHQFMAEEGHAPERDSEYLWVIDPLDGTTNFALGIPHFAVSIALARRGRAVLGVVYDPVQDETFVAEAGQGTQLNGCRILCARKATMSETALALGYLPTHYNHNPGLALPILLRLYPLVESIRIMGSAAMNLAYVACGRFDICYNDYLNPWDVMAGALLVEEVGGMATDFAGQPIALDTHSILAANDPAYYRQAFGVVQQVLADPRRR